jgi:signal transduction histidine kinase
VRNALRAASGGLKSGRISSEELAEAMDVMEDTCSTLAERVSGLLAPKQGGVLPALGEQGTPLAAIMANIARAHRFTMDGKSAKLRLEGDMKIELAHAAEIEHILDILIDNALRFTPSGVPVEVAAFRHGANIEIQVTDRGKGLTSEQARTLFQPRLGAARRGTDETGSGLGLHLASEQAAKLGGRLSYSNVEPTGARFRLVVPV